MQKPRDPEKLPWYGWLLFAAFVILRIVKTHGY